MDMPKFFKPAIFFVFMVIFVFIYNILFCERTIAVEKISDENDSFYCTVQSNVSKIRIIESGKEHIVKNNQNQVFNISVDAGKMDDLIVKIDYEIIIKNTGKNEVFITELQDYAPNGLTFCSEDNVDWIECGRALRYNGFSHTSTKPGEIEKVHIVFRWDNSGSNLGIKTNYAEVCRAVDMNNNGVKILKSNYNNLANNKFAPIIVTKKSTTARSVIILVMFLILVGILVGKYVDAELQLPRMRRVRYITKKIQKI